MTTTYSIHHSDGRVETFASLRAAEGAARAKWPDGEMGHDGDLRDGGDRTLIWASEEDSVDDDGARAVASIRRASR